MLGAIKRHLKRNPLLLFLYKNSFRALSLLPRDRKLIIFESFNGRQISDNPKAIYEYIKREKPEYKLIWSVDKDFSKYINDAEVEYIVRFSLKWLLKFTRAKYWVTNSRFPLWFSKNKDTVYVQTWHGTPLKRLGGDIKNVKIPNWDTKQYRKEFFDEAKKWDYLISPNRYSTDIFKKAFNYKGNVIETGYPRNDVLFKKNKESEINSIKKRLGIPDKKKIILYAPTWRDNDFHEQGKYKFSLNLNLEKMKEELSEDYIVILRTHYLISDNLDVSKFNNFVFDFSKIGEISDLYLISDILITDYSSVFFDFALLKKPILFYTYDIDSYKDEIRGFYFDLEKEAPGPLMKTTEEIIMWLKKNEKRDSKDNKEAISFKKKFGSLEDGNATERVVNEIFFN